MIESKKFSDYLFNTINYIILIGLTICCLYPVIYVVSYAFSEPALVQTGSKLLIWPRGFNTDAFMLVFKNPNIWLGYKNTLIYVACGTALGMLLCILGAFVLSRKPFPGQQFFMTMLIITMFFGGGLIPTYIVMRSYGLINTVLSQILLGSMSTYNLILVLSYFRSIPESLEESAFLDGANDWIVMWKIYLPLSVPSLAVVALYFIVAKWNNWMTAAIYLTKREYFPLQLFLKEILISGSTGLMGMSSDSLGSNPMDKEVYSEALKNAAIVVSTAPVMCVYPFLQKYFMKGIMLGAIKG